LGTETVASVLITQATRALANCDKEDIKHALMASITLFSRIASETARKLTYSYPMETDRRRTEWREKCLTEKDKQNQ
jgi:hypothetical protein